MTGSVEAFEAFEGSRLGPRAQVNAKLAVGYIRASTEEQQLGPQAQETAIRAYVERHGLELVLIARDLGVSGSAALDERPGLAEALDALVTAKAAWVVVAKRDRLARDSTRAAFVERLVERGGGRVVSADDIAGSKSPEDKLLRAIIDAMAEYETALLRMRTKFALATKKKRGEHLGQVPYGYVRDGLHLAPKASEQAAIEQIVRLRAAGMTWGELAEALNTTAHPARGAAWHATSVRRIYLAEIKRRTA